MGKVEDLSLTRWRYPGIFRIRCIPTNRAYFQETHGEVFFVLRRFFDNLDKGYCDNIELLNDYKKYGRDYFEGYIVLSNAEYLDPVKRRNALDECKASGPGELY